LLISGGSTSSGQANIGGPMKHQHRHNESALLVKVERMMHDNPRMIFIKGVVSKHTS
jgi:hypothetical protein